MKSQYVQIALLSLVIVFSAASAFKNINIKSQTAAVSGTGSGLVAHYTFDGGTATDSAGIYNGVVNGATPAAGQIGGALDFNGSSSNVSFANSPTLTSPFTISLWLNPRQLTTGSLVNFGANGRNLFITGANVIELDLYSSGTFRTFCNKTLTTADLNKWWMLTVVVTSTTDASQWKCYVNGSEVGVKDSNSTGVYAGPSTTNWRISNNGLSNYFFNGVIDDVRIYNRALSAPEVVELSGGQVAPVTPPADPTPVVVTPPASTNFITAASCSYTDVSTAVSAVDSGGTVEVPAGNCTWDQSITTTKPIILKGGIGGQTTITGTVIPLIKYAPSFPDTSHRFRITGFTFSDLAVGNEGIISLLQRTVTPEFIRIDNDIFTVRSSRAVYVVGIFYGVVDSNTFNNIEVSNSMTSTYGNDDVQWSAFGSTRAFGDGNNLYYEDNTYNTSANGIMNDGGQGGRYISRYNLFTGNFGYVYDWHGNQPGGGGCLGGSTCGNASTLIVEMYGNLWNRTTSGYLNSLIGQRGGMAMFFLNKLKTSATTGKSSLYLREEYADDLWPVNSGWKQHVTNSYFWGNWNDRTDGTVLLYPELIEENCGAGPATPWQPQHLYGSASASSDIYCQKFTNDPNGNVWKKSQYTSPMVSPYLSGTTEPNWASVAPRYTIRDGNINWLNMGKGTPIYENVDFFTQKSGTFDGTGINGGAVGAGPLSSRPSTCTVGVGYWATTQSVTSIDSMVGPHPTNPISGTLYKCMSPNTWVAYYQPYTYPHPLRTGNSITPPSLVQPVDQIYVAPPSVAYVSGDFNKDGYVNSLDFSAMSGAWNTSNTLYDLNKDGTVNTLDYSIMVQNWTR